MIQVLDARNQLPDVDKCFKLTFAAADYVRF